MKAYFYRIERDDDLSQKNLSSKILIFLMEYNFV
jgi:hypothetical protein